MRWLIKFLLLFTTHTHDLPGYMERRWIILPRSKQFIQIRLHQILRSDSDRHLHDHPWWYLTIILTTGYLEVTQAGQRVYRPGAILLRHANHLHRLEIPYGKTAWTLFICGPKSKEWGFMTEQGWIKWDSYESEEEVTYHKGFEK